MRHPISSPSRFKPTFNRSIAVQLARDKATLREEIVDRLAEGYTTRSRLVIGLRMSLELINDALAQLKLAGRIENFATKSSRGRLDVYGCLPGQSTRGKAPESSAAGFLLHAKQPRHANRARLRISVMKRLTRAFILEDTACASR